jgi:hypothetical protein
VWRLLPCVDLCVCNYDTIIHKNIISCELDCWGIQGKHTSLYLDCWVFQGKHICVCRCQRFNGRCCASSVGTVDSKNLRISNGTVALVSPLVLDTSTDCLHWGQ